ncbi:MAG: NADAR family protein [Agriterribacter sp.]
MRYNNQWLKEGYSAGKPLSFLFFWGHKPSKDGSITKSCFSQWWMSPFEKNGITYPTAEHWMMAGKAKLFNDTDIEAKILAEENPDQVKKLGRLIKGFDAALWDENKFEIVCNGNQLKFSQHPSLQTFLLSTSDKILVEASPVDAVWGIGMSADHADIENPLKWNGENLLGYALMEVRDQLKNTK